MSSHPMTTICGAFCGVRFPGGAGDARPMAWLKSTFALPSVAVGLHVTGGGGSGGGTIIPLPLPPLLPPELAPLLPPELAPLLPPELAPLLPPELAPLLPPELAPL